MTFGKVANPKIVAQCFAAHLSEFRDFPDFGPWAFSSWTEDGRQQDSDVRLFMGICFRLLSLLGCQMPALDYGDIEDASEAIRELQHDPFPSVSLRKFLAHTRTPQQSGTHCCAAVHE